MPVDFEEDTSLALLVDFEGISTLIGYFSKDPLLLALLEDLKISSSLSVDFDENNSLTLDFEKVSLLDFEFDSLDLSLPLDFNENKSENAFTVTNFPTASLEVDREISERF